ncbi:hypothetical protein [Sphingomicrobium marinum]|uniref:hypothetical protein n=1 Tax=Sphingomicrobium marinum TaxID=1227950 RepID=UPI00223FB87A|nr:hypothetical protein [Sphingomicrobium marinum]
MRTLIVLPILALAACGSDAENVVVENAADAPLDLEDTGADVTAIDAATGDASGMAGEPVDNSEED